ncbi:MAG: glycosyltransferase family 2 protein [Treponema sp.]|jgi:glycosyltransferase involved in cell wall biosynthesis|nr:glycosyltransferase family 2 protein [Treponema sp.]
MKPGLTPFRAGLLIPVYNHGKTAFSITGTLSSLGLPIILVDDGSGSETKAYLEKAAAFPGVVLLTLEKNTGKGGAVMAGMEKAGLMGLSHVLQIDADGQHDIAKAAFFLEESRKAPERIICGFPQYSGDAPGSRLAGRKISNFWAAVETLSGELNDVLCGFRVYPVLKSLEVIKKNARRLFPMDTRMGFDPEILVRLYWAGVRPLYFPVRVRYFPDGISHFHMVKDNIRLSLMFTRLFFGMVLRFPVLIWFRVKYSKRQKGM